MPTPADQVAFVNNGATGTIDLGNNLSPISFNNSSPFTFEVWIRFRQQPATTAAVLQKQGEFSLTYSPTGNIGVWRAGMYATMTSSTVVAANQWVHLCVAFDGQTLTLYFMGVQDCFTTVTAAGVPDQGHDFMLGTGGNADVDACRMWSICQTTNYIYEAPWAPESAALTPGLVANYDLSQTPPLDLSGNHHPITLIAPATSVLSAPGVLLAGSAYVDPAEQDVIRCGDSPYTVDAWLYLTSTTGQQAIFASGNLNDPGTVALWLDGGVFKSQRGATVLAATTAIPAQTWTHVATTYDGSTLVVYVNGAAAGSMTTGAIPSLVGEESLIGAFNTAAGGQTNFFQGYIQYVSAWTIALDAAQVLALMYQDPTLQPGCVANFAFSQTLPVDLNTGEPLTLQGGAVLGEQFSPATQSFEGTRSTPALVLPEKAYQRATRRRLHRADATLRRLCETVQRGAKRLDAKEQATLLVDELRAAIPDHFSDEHRSRILGEHAERVAQSSSPGASRLGTVTHAIVDGHHVLTLHGPNGPEEVFRAEVGTVDPCTVWWVQFVFTLLWGVAGLLGLTAPVTAKLTAFVNTLIADLSFMAAVAPLFTAAVTGQTVLSFLGLLYNNGYLWTFFKFCFSQLSWWGIGRLVFYVVGLFVPAPSPAKVQFFVNVVALIFNLVQLLLNKPC